MQGSEGGQRVQNAQETALHDVLNIEREAQSIIADAEAQAERMVSDARRQSREAQMHAEYQAQSDAEEDIQTALRYAEQATLGVKKRTEDEVTAWERQARARLGATVEWVVRMVTLAGDDGDAPRN